MFFGSSLLRLEARSLFIHGLYILKILINRNLQMDKLIKIIKKLMIQFAFLLFSSVTLHAQDLTKIFTSGQEAFAQGKYHVAEKFFGQVLGKDSDNYKVLRAQADTKIKLKKFQEAEDLLNRILAMPESKGRNIMVFLKGKTEGREEI